MQLSHVDRGVYEALELRVARHPSESEEFLCARVLAYCLEQREGLAFSRGLADPDQPALEVRDLTGALQAWIEVGAPDAARLHRAEQGGAARGGVHAPRRRALLGLAGEGAHPPRRGARAVRARPRAGGALVARLTRRMAFDLSVTDGMLYLTLGGSC